MKEVIEIYTKLIVAIISFIAPLIIHLLSMFSEAVFNIKRLADNELKQLNELTQKQIQNPGNGNSMQDIIQKSNSQYKEREHKLKQRLDVLDPKKQIKKIFPTLFFSLVFIGLYYLANSQIWHKEYNDQICWLLILLSVIFACLGISFLKKVAWTVIEIKEEIAQELNKNKEVPVGEE